MMYTAAAIAAVKKCLFKDAKEVKSKDDTSMLQFGWLDRIIYWSKAGVTVSASPMKSVPNVAISDHMPVSKAILRFRIFAL